MSPPHVCPLVCAAAALVVCAWGQDVYTNVPAAAGVTVYATSAIPLASPPLVISALGWVSAVWVPVGAAPELGVLTLSRYGAVVGSARVGGTVASAEPPGANAPLPPGLAWTNACLDSAVPVSPGDQLVLTLTAGAGFVAGAVAALGAALAVSLNVTRHPGLLVVTNDDGAGVTSSFDVFVTGPIFDRAS